MMCFFSRVVHRYVVTHTVRLVKGVSEKTIASSGRLSAIATRSPGPSVKRNTRRSLATMHECLLNRSCPCSRTFSRPHSVLLIVWVLTSGTEQKPSSERGWWVTPQHAPYPHSSVYTTGTSIPTTRMVKSMYASDKLDGLETGDHLGTSLWKVRGGSLVYELEVRWFS
ncbi:hypothetical protein EDC04DRAFT_291703 [Pisolithus marmoratus]|nr:hypothetical protein EDC04DRAFT_291703 [Pisolithus marmoratus]